jgi:hypothetical protein
LERIGKLENELCGLLRCQKGDLQRCVEKFLDEAPQQLANAEERLNNAKQWREDRMREITDLRSEVYFQQLRSKEEEITWWLDEGLKEVREKLRSAEDFLTSINMISC